MQEFFENLAVRAELERFAKQLIALRLTLLAGKETHDQPLLVKAL